MGINNRMIGGIDVTPELIAHWFWEMNSEEQADFFSKLHEISEGMLCMQIAYTVSEIRTRAAHGDGSALEGFQRMLAHSAAYVEDGIEARVWEAKQDIAELVRAAKGDPT